jgi:hypothetical protein
LETTNVCQTTQVGREMICPIESLCNLIFLIKNHRHHPDLVLRYAEMADEPIDRLIKISIVNVGLSRAA